MALRKRTLKNEVSNTGLINNIQSKNTRFINKDGTANVINTGLPFLERFNLYSYLINVPAWKFILIVFGFYTAINFLFAVVYYFFCLKNLSGLIPGTALENFEEAYFFSSQTLTTVGYGRISPIGFFANTVASIEALIGIMTLAIITGLLYGRFVKPRAFVRFSSKALIAPFKNGNAIMVRVAPLKKAKLSEVSVTLTAGILLEENGVQVNKYYTLPLQFDTINNLFISWTVVHPLDENSPLYQLSFEDLKAGDFELMVFLKAFEEDFSNTVIARTSYTISEMENGARFIPIFHEDVEARATIADYSKLDEFVPVPQAAI